MGKQVTRLFEKFKPTNYALKMSINSAGMTFTGSVKITGQIKGRPSKRLTLHQKGLQVSKAKITFHNKNTAENINVVRINKHEKLNELRLHSDQTLYSGLYTVEVEFSGNITNPMHGIYPCYFMDNGEQKKLIATQFESHHAREAFPCIDEPEAKATFDLSLLTAKDHIVLANTPVVSEQKSANGLTETIFETTPIMSTYLLAFVTGEMHCVEATTSDGILMRTWATVAQPIKSLQYANNEAVKILEFFTDYFQTAFPLKKCDQVALPDFEAGAMENWGLVTYREIALLADPDNRSLSSEQYVSMVIGHELSHQWFGNLVTMKWWDDLWLNESFASLMEHIALDGLHPDWFQWEQYTASDVIVCSSRDVFKDVQSVHVPVNHPDEISTLFDPAIVYAKGGRLLKMMREYIGDEAFRLALKNYFAKHAYKNTIGDDLWAEMSTASGKNIKDFMHPWLDQSGMPVVSIDQTGEKIHLEQKRFVLDSDNDQSLWPVPLLSDHALNKEVFDSRKLDLSKSDDSKPIVLNQYGSGHMLVHYLDNETQKYIAKSFGSQILKPETRINVLNDQLLLSRKGEASLTEGLDIVCAASSEPRDAVWQIMSRTIATAIGLTEGDEDTEKRIKAFRSNLAVDWYRKLGWDDIPADDPNTRSLRQTALSLVIAGDSPEAIHEAKKRYEAAGSVEALDAEQRAMIVSAGVKNDFINTDDLISEYKSSPNPDVQLAIAMGLTNTRRRDIGKKIIDQALGNKVEGFVRPQDIFRWYAYLMRNRYTRIDAWEWLKNNWDRLELLFGDGKSFDYFIIYSASPINTVEGQKQFNDFFLPKSDDLSLKRNINIAISEIEARVSWRKREESVIQKYFATKTQ